MHKRETMIPLERGMREILSKVHGTPIGIPTYQLTEKGESYVLAKDLGDEMIKAFRELGGGYLAKGITRGINVFVAIASFIIGMFVFSTTITGNVIADVNPTTTNILGVILIITSIISCIIFYKKK